MNSFLERTAGYRNRILVGISLFRVLLFIGGIAYLILHKTSSHVTPVGEILQDVSRFDRQEVTIRGTIRRVFTVPLINKSFVLVEDKTGEIWCRLERTDVEEGQVIFVTGIVYKLFWRSPKAGGVEHCLHRALECHL